VPCEPTVERLLVLLAERDTVIARQAQAIEGRRRRSSS